jgi:hypothetical protein
MPRTCTRAHLDNADSNSKQTKCDARAAAGSSDPLDAEGHAGVAPQHPPRVGSRRTCRVNTPYCSCVCAIMPRYCASFKTRSCPRAYVTNRGPSIPLDLTMIP